MFTNWYLKEEENLFTNWYLKEEENLFTNWYLKEEENLFTNWYLKEEPQTEKTVGFTEVDRTQYEFVPNHLTERGADRKDWHANETKLCRDKSYYTLCFINISNVITSF